MILHALYEYYQRLAADPESGIAPEGFERKEIPFLILLDAEGNFRDLQDVREGIGRNLRAKRYLVPKDCGRTSGVRANLLWDNPKYVLAYAEKPSDQEKANLCHRAFLARFEECFSDMRQTHTGLGALGRFLEKQSFDAILSHPLWREVVKSKGNLTFQLDSDYRPIAEDAAIQARVREKTQDLSEKSERSICLISGKPAPLALLHPAIKGVAGGQISGCFIVSFNFAAARSYGKESGDNAPVSQSVAFAYTTALNYLLQKGSRHKLQVADMTMVFWAEKQEPIEDFLFDLFVENKDDPTRNSEAIRALYSSPWRGSLSVDEDDATRFYVLGLAPNASRISIRFWEVTTVSGLVERLKEHFNDIKICHGPKMSDFLPLNSLIRSVAVQGKLDHVAPNHAADMTRAVFSGAPYPLVFLQEALTRTRAEQDVPYWRAALIKACVNRFIRSEAHSTEKELTVSLDETNDNIGYCLGRLFAVLEKIQEESHPGINATIRDRYYGSASSTPVVAFSPLMRMKNHHLAKLENRGRVVNFERLLARIMEYISDFPSTLSLHDQGRFAIGYYHQRQAFFSKSSEASQSQAEPVSV
ncbi:MAG: type I-C CRISPR-associated protein Cas8c/Csd1 [Vampirovibrionales bacterium]|nr:type I-C CRISPR-associated protein Cas8c/Csd1 [Vampirovibrionales bacterium]